MSIINLLNSSNKDNILHKKNENRVQTVAKKTFFSLFLLLISLTFLARATQALTIPTVKVEEASDGRLIYNITGEGALESKTEKFYDLPEGVRVESILVNAGDYIKEGDILLILNREDIKKLIKVTKRKLIEIEIQMEQVHLENLNNKLAQLQMEDLQLDYDEINDEYKKLEQIQNNNGIMKAKEDGRVDEIGIQKGEKIPNQAEIAIGTAGFNLHAEIEEEYGKYLDIGDVLLVSRIGKNDKFEANIINKKQDNNNYVEVIAELPKDQKYTTDTLTYFIQKNSKDYKNCVPVAALREDTKGTFLYILEESDSLFGKELHAKRVDVIVLKKDSVKAVIKEGRVLKGDRIIISSDKMIGDKDKVRIED